MPVLQRAEQAPRVAVLWEDCRELLGADEGERKEDTMTANRVRNLPSGKTTTSERRYTMAWRRLASATEVAMLKSTSLQADPGIKGLGFELSTLSAIKLWEYVNKRDWTD